MKIESKKQMKKNCFVAIIHDWGQFVSRLIVEWNFTWRWEKSCALLVYVMTYWTRTVVAVNVVKPIIKAAARPESLHDVLEMK